MNDTESAFVCAVMHDQNILYRVSIKPDDLQDINCRMVLSACYEISAKNATPDFVAVANHLRGIVNPADIGAIHEMGATHVNWEFYANKLKHEIMNRKLLGVGPYLSELMTSGEDPKDVISKTSEYLDNISIGFNDYRITKFSELLPDWYKDLQARISDKNCGMTGVPTGMDSLDEITGGFQDKLLYYVGGRPSDGKSASLNGFVLAAVKSSNRPGIITVESSAGEILTRTASSSSRVPLSKIKAGTLTPSQISYLIDSGADLNDIDPVVYDEPNATLQTVCTQARRMVSVYGCKIVFVDYVQQISPDNRSMPRNEQVADISKALKSLARSLSVPVVSAAQLKRPKDTTKHSKPTMDDLADSSQLEKDADGIGLIHHGIDSDTQNAFSFMHWDKVRDGETRSIPVYFNKEIVRFEEKNS